MNVKGKLDILRIEKRAFIDGKYVWAKKENVIHKISSIDGTDITGIAACDTEDINQAVVAAKTAYDDGRWTKLVPEQRKHILLKLADLMEENKEELALLDTYETGRAYNNYYKDSIPKAISLVRYFAESIDKYYDVSIPPRGSEFGIITRIPLGVVGLITPWNDPLVVASWKFAPALLMGNTVVIKPAEQSSLSMIKVASLAQEAGIPDGVFNVVPGYGETAGKALALHPDVRGIFFTGSSEIGKLIIQYSGQSNMKKIGLECGGKSPYIVTKNCKDLKNAAIVLADNMFYNQGQICSAPSRVIIDESVADQFIFFLKEECERYVPGDPFESDNRVGSVVSREQYEKIQSYIQNARERGIEIYQAQTQKPHSEWACCIQPTLLLNVSNDDVVAREEIFGPVVVIIRVSSTEEAVKVANDTKYGLAGAVWTNDLDEAYYVTRNLEAGLVHVNSYGNDDNSAPFGGVKESGIGKDKSMYSFDEYSNLKTIWMHFEQK